MACFELCVSLALMQNEDIWNFHGSLTLNKGKLRACSHEPGTVYYPGVMIAPGQASPRVHMMIC